MLENKIFDKTDYHNRTTFPSCTYALLHCTFLLFQERQVTGDHYCRFVPNVPYAFISSTLTFWFPVIIMLVVYYLVFKEAMKQKQNMERMNNIRSLPVTNRTIKNSFESDKTTQELLEQSNSSDEIAGSISGSGSTPSFTGGAGGGPRPHTISPSELEHLAVTPIKTNTTSFGANPSSIGSSNSLGPGPGGKRISLETAMMDARIKARNSIFVTSGTNIIEGDSKGFSSVSYCKQLYSLERAKASQHLLEEGTQGLRDAGGGDGHLPDLLAPLLHLVPDLHHLRRCLRGPGGGGCGPFLDW